MNKYKYYIKCNYQTFKEVYKNIKIYNLEINDGLYCFYTNKKIDKSFDNLIVNNLLIDSLLKFIKKYFVTIIGSIIFLLIYYILSKTILYLEFNDNNYNDDIYNYINSNITYYGKIGFLNTSIDDLNKDLKKYFYNYEWINVEKKGVNLIINLNNITSDEIKDNIGQNEIIFSKYNAYVLGYYVKKGKILITNNTTVSEGDPLISGFVPSYGDSFEKVIPEGYVIGEVTYSQTLNILNSSNGVYKTGNVKKYQKIIFFNNYKVTSPFENYNYEIEEVFSLGDIFKVINIYYYEISDYKISYNINETILKAKNIIYNNFLKEKKYSFEKIKNIEVINVKENDNIYEITLSINMIKDITN